MAKVAVTFNWKPKMPTVEYRPATIEDAYDLGPRLRKTDIAEIEPISDGHAIELLVDSVMRSAEAYTVLVDNQVVSICGIGTRTGKREGEGVIWLLGAEGGYELGAGVAYAKLSYKWIREAFSRYTKLSNCVEAGNLMSVNWLTKMGFTMRHLVYKNDHAYWYFDWIKKEQ